MEKNKSRKRNPDSQGGGRLLLPMEWSGGFTAEVTSKQAPEGREGGSRVEIWKEGTVLELRKRM